ncbi:cytochrome c oxidase assembly protein [Companilactobacillus sp. RD055328]|uniref:cytochrome d ubiquinol oxidase subunit II n=1 Tax=Companilactobacillus sp. RD055328 TaxID=2916634 RepID=UPI001FC86298|nr:cytochrome d ubiquinol oxidase subunit II [Companilactobacillus sp. RD055328]GKQ43424.1 cytochrome c oxidase assembly protein [Companilactobacillus sp. RD055328]
MTALQLLWFILICVLFVGFFFLEGFDYGVGMSTRLIAKNQEERLALMSSIGPHWDGNETWLVTAGGAMFASLPMWYASLFSGYYILLLLFLTALILRGVSFEFTAHAETKRGKNFWLWMLFIGSTAAPFLLCMMFLSMVQGVTMDAQGNAFVTFSQVVNPLSIVGGVAGTLLSLVHGLNFIRLKTTGVLRKRALDLNKILYPVLFAGEVVFAVLVYFQTDFFTERFVSSLIITLLIVVSSLLGYFGTLKNKEGISLIGSGLSLAFVVILLFNGLFPRVMIATNPAHSILIKDAAASPYTLTIMTVVTCVLLPIMLGYFIWSYYIFRKRVSTEGENKY